MVAWVLSQDRLLFRAKQRAVSIPVEMWARICFSARCDIAVANDMILVDGRVQCLDAPGGIDQRRILLIGKARIIAALEFDSDGKIVAFVLVLEAGNSGMPGSLFQRYKLEQCAIAADKHMGRNPQLRDFPKIRMPPWIQLIQEQFLYPGAAKFARWEADIMDHQQADFSTWRALVMVWRGAGDCLFQPLVCNVIDHDGANYQPIQAPLSINLA